MALRTFRHNPSLGGFGGESGLSSSSSSLRVDTNVGADAFCQIVKELVDNAIDACRSPINRETTKSTKKKRGKNDDSENALAKNSIMHRVRVNLDPTTQDDGAEVLRVTVTDNGVGMKDIQSCVDAFQTSKGHNADGCKNKGAPQDKNTSGRYGIGLTLCLLHAQRLVPNTRASIKSATTAQEQWTVMTCVVDTEADSVRCFPGESLAKSTQGESGTSISLLVPGGTTAVLAWPRLAEYFARFQLSLGLNSRLEVLAPSLSSVPLQVRPVSGTCSVASEPNHTAAGKTPRKQRPAWKDPLLKDRGNVDHEHSNVVTPDEGGKRPRGRNQDKTVSTDRLLSAAQQFLERPVLPTNLAHSIVPIRLTATKSSNAPTMEVALVVHGSSDKEEDRQLEEHEGAPSAPKSNAEASMVLIRMVNQIPLLDSDEGVACGLVQGVAAKQNAWQAVGLEVSLKVASTSMARVPMYSVKDSTQVLPFLKSQQGIQFNEDNDDEHSSHDSDDESITEAILEGRKRPRRRPQKGPDKVFLPADARLGNILLIAQINAQPSQLPLPTLCKGRIPQDNSAINQALETALKACLRKLQTTNPALFLTARELRVVERKVCFVPLLSNAMASILRRSQSEIASEAIVTVKEWREDESSSDGNQDDSSNDTDDTSNVDRLGQIIHNRLQILLDHPEKSARRDQVSDAEEDEALEEEDGKSKGTAESRDELSPFASIGWGRQQADQESMRDVEKVPSEDEGDAYEDLI